MTPDIKEDPGNSATRDALASVTVSLPHSLVALFPGASRAYELTPGTVAEILEQLQQRHPGMRDRLCDSTTSLRKRINVFVDGRRASLETPVSPGAEMHIMTAVCEGG